jgi:putative hemolysin
VAGAAVLALRRGTVRLSPGTSTASAGLPLDAGALTGTVLVLAVLLLVCAFFNLAEVSLFALQKGDRESLRNRGSAGNAVLMMLREPRTLLASILIGVEVANIALGAVSAELARAIAPGMPWLNVAIVAPLVILVGDILPKALGIHFARGASVMVARPLLLWNLVIAPIRWVIDLASAGVLFVLGGRNAPVEASLREEHLRVLIDQGRMAGAIQPIEQEFIHRVFDFGDLPVSRLMTPRPDVFSLPLNTPWADLLEAVREQRYSRIPIWQGSPDNVVGVLLVKDLLRLRNVASPTQRQLQRILRPAPFVPPSKRAQDLLREFRARKQHMALVVDEHGTCIGLVTLDDLLRELVGETPDEDDGPEAPVTELAPGRWRVDGGMDVGDFAARFACTLPEGDWHTVAGFVLHRLGRLPEKGDEAVWDEDATRLTFRVTGVQARRIEELVVETAPLERSREPEDA